MSYAVVVNSRTGNTKLLADTIVQCFNQEEVVYVGEVSQEAKKADVIFVGFWTDKGCCTEEVKQFLHNLKGKKIFLFGTAGFGANQAYFQQILERVKQEISSDNTIIGTYMCQGKMPMAVRDRYVALKEKEPENKRHEMMIQNFDVALSHPNESDLELLKEKVKDSLS